MESEQLKRMKMSDGLCKGFDFSSVAQKQRQRSEAFKNDREDYFGKFY